MSVVKHFPTASGTHVKVTEPLIDAVARVVVASGLHWVTSVGCGNGCFEYYLADQMTQRGYDLHVKGIELREPAFDFDPIAYARHVTITYVMPYHPCAVVPATDVLMFVWGKKAKWYDYMRKFQGDWVVFVAEHDFDLVPSQENVDKEVGPCWQKDDELSDGSVMLTVYRRRTDTARCQA